MKSRKRGMWRRESKRIKVRESREYRQMEENEMRKGANWRDLEKMVEDQCIFKAEKWTRRR